MPKTGYTEPTVWDRKGNIKAAWCVGFRMTNPSTGFREQVQIRRDINDLKTKSQRYAYGKTLCGIVKDALLAGWNPFAKDFETFIMESLEMEKAGTGKIVDPEAVDITNLSYADLPFNEAIELAYNNKISGLKKASVAAYRTVRNFAKEAALKIGAELKLADLPVSQVKRAHIKLLLAQMERDRIAAYQKEYNDKVEKEKRLVQEKRKDYKPRTFKMLQFTGNTYNKYKDTLFTFFGELEELEAVEYNPCSKIADRPEITTNIHRHATAEEERDIKKHLRENHLQLYVYLAVEELSGMRPDEILALTINDIDWKTQSFNQWEGDAKNRTRRLVPIPNTLVPLLKLLNLGRHLNQSDYIFSDRLLPGPRKIQEDKVGKLWKRLIHKELNIHVSLYSFKGLGADKKIDAGIRKKVVSEHSLGHTDERTTNIYLEREDERNRRSIIEDTPEFDVHAS